MGLDSVELLMEFERFFGIDIPNADAESMITINDAVEVIARLRKISSDEKFLWNDIYSRVIKCLEPAGNYEINRSSFISAYLDPSDVVAWNSFQSCVSLDIPEPEIEGSKQHRFLRLFGWKPRYDWRNIPIDSFVDCICIHNYKSLVQPAILRSKHEIYIAVAGLTSDKIGVDCYELSPEKIFTTDLGLD